MYKREAFALGAVGLMMLFGSISCASFTVTLVLHTWSMAVDLGVREVLSYIITTSIVGILSLLALPVLFLTAAAMAMGPWMEDRGD
ncbi:hypothetical protein B7R56_15730 [Pseudomonas savastanoi pv. retacarpa]|uniref:Uncharacterized protein n=1 Tax=Pseudomonas savastanoi pv. savastanoi NCPPB 3335 TaxID=693985 RepID=A0ABC8BJ19_PSESS|nr:hypothetical protein PSA3335_26035 [Pseudomonas savastanoi pv. savastanoi NCPPB 3335]KPY45914.1 Trypsin domain protein [Pseudomonas savastanoi pv. retacarpa]KTC55825.1 hypothetical protein AO258_20955 [Pseudomonas syringae ICMP 19498]RMP23054.1 hypothetical protein ALQ25_200291 [Pseudomonas coronafaciens pv. atropurpurea]OSR27487.1 hypothetical protein B7R56_15730 [Pseudomonas savastanoi pv. retacarpa]